MSMIADYMRERAGRQTIENHTGFAAFEISGDVCYLADIYVKPEFRRSHMATLLADQVVMTAKQEGCTKLLGSVETKANNVTESLKTVLSYGFKFERLDDTVLYFIKEI